jgi:hypothetical protein
MPLDVDPLSTSAIRARPNRPSSRPAALRIFCTARAGDWRRAALVLQTARTLGALPDRAVSLLERFLDSGLAEDGETLRPPVRPTPLEFRLFEALGEPLPTAPLPLAFSVLDLTGDNGWKAQVEAAERLARAGALPPERLRALYTLRRPAASGGVWDRVAALQAFERALERGPADRVARALGTVWPQMASAGLLVAFAELYAEELATHDLGTRAQARALRALLLSSAYENGAAGAAANGAERAFLLAVARGVAPQDAAPLPHATAVRAGFAGAPVPDGLAALLAQGRVGEAALRAVALFQSGAQGNPGDLTDAIATLRALGLEDTARRAALQLMLLDAERARR